MLDKKDLHFRKLADGYIACTHPKLLMFGYGQDEQIAFDDFIETFNLYIEELESTGERTRYAQSQLKLYKSLQ